jgi:hypothetical protein
MTTTKHDAIMARIERHGRQLLAIFPNAEIIDPVLLCKRLRSIEASASRMAEAYCNGDPRGYALKIDLQVGEELHRDWGGYGIIAPDLSEQD